MILRELQARQSNLPVSKIKRTSGLFNRPARHTMGINHRRPHIRVSEQFLNGTDIVIGLQEMGSKTVAEGM